MHITKPYFEQLESLTVDDVDEDGWPILTEALERYGRNIKVLNLEACGEKEPFQGKKSLSSIFSTMDKLECLRLDATPIGISDDQFAGDIDVVLLCSRCLNLRAVSIDYCNISLDSFYILWNNCPNLEFIGLAGIQGTDSEANLEYRPSMKTLRFVDCQINDALVRFVN